MLKVWRVLKIKEGREELREHVGYWDDPASSMQSLEIKFEA